jgi:DnaK suppressor protein
MVVSFDEFRARLEHQRDKLQAELAEARAQAGNGLGYSTHQADHGSEAFEQAADLAMRQNAERLLYEVERALQRIEAGTYGICHDCGEAIDPARLTAIPYARYCMDCASRHERR